MLPVFKNPFSFSLYLILQKIKWKKPSVPAVPLTLLAWPLNYLQELSQSGEHPPGSFRKHGRLSPCGFLAVLG